MKRLREWAICRFLTLPGVPDLPEVRRALKMTFWNGLTFGALERRAKTARAAAFEALRNYHSPE
jgi:hypothetical protein